jgi:type II secretory pathway predicted ATPase ExeA
MSLEEATEKHRSTGGRLAEIAKERKALPGQIQEAAAAGDSKTLSKLSARKVAIEAEFTAADVADRKAQLEVFESELAEASARASQLTNQLPGETQRLKDDRQELLRRLEENDRTMNQVVNEEVAARRVVDEMRNKVTGAQQALSRYIKESTERAAA